MIYINSDKISNIKFNEFNFYVAVDFDKTITANESTDSWDASGKILGEEFRKRLYDLYYKYGPIEQDYNIGFEEKFKFMEEWYYGCMDLYYEYGLTREKLEESINNSNLIFRKGAREFLNEMYSKNIPVIILSAGIGNVIEQFLRKNNCYYSNINIINNFISFDKAGNMNRCEGNLIHTLNKTMDGKVNKNLEDKLRERKYKLLLGDFIEDKNMVPAKEWDNTITVRIPWQESRGKS